MKRDFDLIRAILLDIEKNVPAVPDELGYHFDHEDQDSVAYALYLMAQKGLIEDAYNIGDHGTHEADSYGHPKLTWDGCVFLDTVRDEEIWRKTKLGVANAGSFSFDLLKALAKGLIKTKIEQHTGLELNL